MRTMIIIIIFAFLIVHWLVKWYIIESSKELLL